MGERSLGRGGVIAGSVLVLAVFGAVGVRAQTQSEMNQQAGGDFKAADHKLNAVYAKLRARLEPKQKLALETAERSWIKFRDDHCKFQTINAEDGSAYDMAYGDCRQELTEDRIKQLQYQLTCEEGDLSCVSPRR